MAADFQFKLMPKICTTSLLVLEVFILLEESLCPNLELVVLLVHVVQSSLKVIHLLVIQILDIVHLSGLVVLNSLDLMGQLGIFLPKKNKGFGLVLNYATSNIQGGLVKKPF